jgi:DNA-binding response OmpR family regulator
MITLLKMAKVVGRRFIKERELVIDLSEKKVTVNSEEVKISPVEFFLLRFLAVNKGKAVSADQLLTYLWKRDIFLLEDGLDVIMDTLISKIEGGQFIQKYIIKDNNNSYRFLEV